TITRSRDWAYLMNLATTSTVPATLSTGRSPHSAASAIISRLTSLSYLRCWQSNYKRSSGGYYEPRARVSLPRGSQDAGHGGCWTIRHALILRGGRWQFRRQPSQG